jgi:hypothetical protein
MYQPQRCSAAWVEGDPRKIRAAETIAYRMTVAFIPSRVAPLRDVVSSAEPTSLSHLFDAERSESRGATLHEAAWAPGGVALMLIHGALNVIPQEELRIVMGVQAE